MFLGFCVPQPTLSSRRSTPTLFLKRASYRQASGAGGPPTRRTSATGSTPGGSTGSKHSAGGGALRAGTSSAMEDLKSRAAKLQDKLADLHTEFSQSSSKQAEAEGWQEQWQEQVRQVGSVQSTLRSEGVGLNTATDLNNAERATAELEQQLKGMAGGQASK